MSPANDINEPVPYTESRVEILTYLRAVTQQRLTMEAYFGNDEFFLTALIEVDEKNNRIVLDWGIDQAKNARALAAGELLLVTVLEKVKVRFQVHGLKQGNYQNGPAFFAPLPRRAARLQRRQFYRMPTPIANPLRCEVPITSGSGVARLTVNLLDLSVGGVGIIDQPRSGQGLSVGARYPDCRITLPEIGVVVGTLEVRNCMDVTNRNGTHSRRFGCQFVSVPTQMQNMIQRYITQLERDRRSRESGWR